ncbi:hypothetical protein Ahy_B09g094782 isoform B [Arachis hypogaea]|uniref:Uncharacterized protein n=1 Tax=Arachis hypogaea TaxID=3818 RepID=A0A444XCA1_ARAHY|nr:hypothetical protein Ahy_B09g094782 isoform B [Arachis hypogaea]
MAATGTVAGVEGSNRGGADGKTLRDEQGCANLQAGSRNLRRQVTVRFDRPVPGRFDGLIAPLSPCSIGLTASLSATPIAGERPPPTTSQPPPPSSQRSPSTAPTQDLLADRAAQHCSTQPAPSAQQVGTTLASRTHHHPQSLATRKSHPASQDHPLTQDHPADTEHRIKSDMEPEPPSQYDLSSVGEYVTDFYLPWSRYKGGPSLPRKLISQGATQKQYSVEVYPLILKLTDARDKSVSTVKLSKKNAEKTEENSNAAWRKHRSSHLSSPFLNVQPPPLLQLRRNVALVRRASASFLAKLLRLFFGQPLFELLSPLFSPLRRVFEPLFSLCSAAFQPPFAIVCLHSAISVAI